MGLTAETECASGKARERRQANHNTACVARMLLAPAAAIFLDGSTTHYTGGQGAYSPHASDGISNTLCCTATWCWWCARGQLLLDCILHFHLNSLTLCNTRLSCTGKQTICKIDELLWLGKKANKFSTLIQWYYKFYFGLFLYYFLILFSGFVSFLPVLIFSFNYQTVYNSSFLYIWSKHTDITEWLQQNQTINRLCEISLPRKYRTSLVIYFFRAYPEMAQVSFF